MCERACTEAANKSRAKQGELATGLPLPPPLTTCCGFRRALLHRRLVTSMLLQGKRRQRVSRVESQAEVPSCGVGR